jgi:hypothetical protein
VAERGLLVFGIATMLAGLMAVGSRALVVVPEPGCGRRRGRRLR